MLIHRTYESPSACARLFKALDAEGLCQSGGDVLRMIYRDPAKFFSSDSVVILHYDAAQKVDGVLIVARGFFFAKDIAARLGDDHYGFIQIFVREDMRRKGIGRSMMARLVEVSPKQKFALLQRVLVCVPKAMQSRFTALYPASLAWALSPKESRFYNSAEAAMLDEEQKGVRAA